MALATLLAGDLGGTKTLLLFAEPGSGRILLERRFENAGFPGLDDVLLAFLAEGAAAGLAPPATACLGVAGPVRSGAARITNLHWQVSEAGIAQVTGAGSVRLINDFEAVGHGIDCLAPDDVIELQAGSPRQGGARAVIGAGTGLGEAVLVPLPSGWKVLPSEGAHVDFAPRDEFEAGLWRWLRQRYGHVSYERIVSGEGLVNVFAYLRDVAHLPVSAELSKAMALADPAAAISEFGLDGRDVAAAKALEVFVGVYGAEAGNLALKCLPHDGLYIAGGIAPKLAGKLGEGGFIRAFRDKGRFAGLLAEIPVRLVNNPRVGLLGAARVAGLLPI